MDQEVLARLKSFVFGVAQDIRTTFTLDGQPVHPADLADPKLLLPLVVAAMEETNAEIQGMQPRVTSVLEPADPTSHMLGWRITGLPSIDPEGAMWLVCNHAVRQKLVREPLPKLEMPATNAAPLQSELRAHLVAFGLAALPAKTTAVAGPVM